jgi:hypothetical protein
VHAIAFRPIWLEQDETESVPVETMNEAKRWISVPASLDVAPFQQQSRAKYSNQSGRHRRKAVVAGAGVGPIWPRVPTIRNLM